MLWRIVTLIPSPSSASHLLFPFLPSPSLSFPLASLLSLFSPSAVPPPSTTDYRLVIICSNEDEDKSHIISRLSPHKKHFTGLHDVAKYREYLKIRFTGTMPLQSQTLRSATQGIHASIVDLEEYVVVWDCVHTHTYAYICDYVTRRGLHNFYPHAHAQQE